jgi:hypothetical protein
MTTTELINQLDRAANARGEFQEQLLRDGCIHLHSECDTTQVRAIIRSMEAQGWTARPTDKGLALFPPAAK